MRIAFSAAEPLEPRRLLSGQFTDAQLISRSSAASDGPGWFVSVDHIIAYGLGGDDVIAADSTLTAATTLHGGRGSDVLLGGRGVNRIFAD